MLFRSLYEAFRAVLADEVVRRQMLALGMVPQSSPPPDKLQGFIDAEQARWEIGSMGGSSEKVRSGYEQRCRSGTVRKCLRGLKARNA